MKQALQTIVTNDGVRIATLTLPDEPGAVDHGVMVLLSNTGLNNRSGPHRINVKVARHLARTLGLPSLRIDLVGLGDSPHGNLGRDHDEQAIDDLRAAMDHAGRTLGIQRFVMVGLCSGAFDGWSTALLDPRICGLVMVDGPAHPSSSTRWHSLVRGLRLRPWHESVQMLGKKVASHFTKKPSPHSAEPIDSIVPIDSSHDHEPSGLPRALFAQDAQRLIERGTSIYMINTSTWSRYYSYPEQFLDVFGDHAWAKSVQVDFCPEFDHTFNRLEAQWALLQRLQTWIGHHLPHWQGPRMSNALTPPSNQDIEPSAVPNSTSRSQQANGHAPIAGVDA